MQQSRKVAELDPAPGLALRVEALAPSALGLHRAAWVALCGRALDGNVFLHPGFALPLLLRPDRPASVVLTVWSDDGRMVGLLPIARPRPSLAGRIRGFRDGLVTTGTPLLDRGCAEVAFAAMLDWLAYRYPGAVALTLSAVPADGAFTDAVIAALEPLRRVDVLATRRRAVLRRAPRGIAAVLPIGSAKSRKDRKRQRRRLAEHGSCAYVSARSPDAVAAATEAFLTLEGDGWKGQRRTALRSTPALAAFARAMTQVMAEAGRCRIDALELDGRPIAMGIVLMDGDRAHFWKTAFDETLAALSPGVHFTAELADAQLADDGVALTDSCAVPDHPMIDRVWPDRMDVVDLAVALRPHRSPRLSAGIGLERARRRARAGAKALGCWMLRRLAALRKRRPVPI